MLLNKWTVDYAGPSLLEHSKYTCTKNKCIYTLLCPNDEDPYIVVCVPFSIYVSNLFPQGKGKSTINDLIKTLVRYIERVFHKEFPFFLILAHRLNR